MLELADEADSKSAAGDSVRVRPPLPANKKRQVFKPVFFVLSLREITYLFLEIA